MNEVLKKIEKNIDEAKKKNNYILIFYLFKCLITSKALR